MESVDNKEGVKNTESRFNQEIHTNVVRAGKRTYFFDVKSTRNNEYYLTITESKKRYTDQGKFHFEKHKIFLYKEDFDKFADSLEEIIAYIRENQPVQEEAKAESDAPEVKSEETVTEEEAVKKYSDIEFDDI